MSLILRSVVTLSVIVIDGVFFGRLSTFFTLDQSRGFHLEKLRRGTSFIAAVIAIVTLAAVVLTPWCSAIVAHDSCGRPDPRTLAPRRSLQRLMIDKSLDIFLSTFFFSI
jgi:hypothetical protein